MHLKKTVANSAVERNEINGRDVVVPNLVGERRIEVVSQWWLVDCVGIRALLFCASDRERRNGKEKKRGGENSKWNEMIWLISLVNMEARAVEWREQPTWHLYILTYEHCYVYTFFLHFIFRTRAITLMIIDWNVNLPAPVLNQLPSTQWEQFLTKGIGFTSIKALE